MPVTYPGGGPRVTVEALLRQPQLIARRLNDLTTQRFVADRILTRGTADQVAGGAALYQKSESIYTDRDAEEVGVRARYPRAGWTEQVFAAAVKKYGLEVPITDEQKRRNQLDVVARAQQKISNSLVKFVDTIAMNMILADVDVQTFAASGDWSTAATDVVADLAKARMFIQQIGEGYVADTLIVNDAQELDLIVDADIRNALPREGQMNAVLAGTAVPILGLRQILVTDRLAAGTALVLAAGTIGTIADEQPMADEGYRTYNPGANAAPVYVKVYREDGRDESIVRGARFPAMWLSEPKAIVKITGA